MEQIRWREERADSTAKRGKGAGEGCSGKQFPDSDLSFSSTTAGGTRPLC
jgi:hypothetical protein